MVASDVPWRSLTSRAPATGPVNGGRGPRAVVPMADIGMMVLEMAARCPRAGRTSTMTGWLYTCACVLVPCGIGGLMYAAFEAWDKRRRRTRDERLPVIDYII